jgi:hypothetical protein
MILSEVMNVAQRLGNLVYWTACGLALLVVFLAVFIISGGLAEFLVAAGLIWLTGKAARYALVG